MNCNDILLSATSDTQIVAQSLYEWVETKTAKITSFSSVLSTCLYTDEDPSAALAAKGIDPLMVVDTGFGYENAGTLIEKFQSAIEIGDDNILLVSGDTASMDEISYNINDLVRSNVVVSQTFKVLSEKDIDSTALSLRIRSKLTTIISDFSGTASLMLSNFDSVVDSVDLSTGQKLAYILDMSGYGTGEKDSFDGTFTSVLGNYSGVTPSSTLVSEVVTDVNNLDENQIVNAIVSTVGVIINGIIQIRDWLGNKVVEQVVNVYQAAENPIDIAINKKFDDLSISNIGFNSEYSSMYNYVTKDYMNEEFGPIYDELEDDKYLCLSAVGAKVYLWRAHGNLFQGTKEIRYVRSTIRWIPISIESSIHAMDALKKATTEEGVANAFGLLSTSYGVIQNNDVASYKAILAAKSWYLLYLLYKNAASVAEFKSDLTNSYAFEQDCGKGYFWNGANPTYIHNVPNFDSIITNKDFATELMSTSDFTPTVVDGAFTDIVDYHDEFSWFMIQQAFPDFDSLTSGIGFIPYVRSTSIKVGKYYVRDDENELAALNNLITGVFIIVMVAIVCIASVKIATYLRKAAIQANVAASVNQNTLQRLVASGTASSTDMKLALNTAYKSTKKFNLINKLTGGFATATTGLANYAVGTSNTSFLGGLDDSSEVIKLIK